MAVSERSVMLSTVRAQQHSSNKTTTKTKTFIHDDKRVARKSSDEVVTVPDLGHVNEQCTIFVILKRQNTLG